jgi:membrane fusion protein (multidrug efflux system)
MTDPYGLRAALRRGLRIALLGLLAAVLASGLGAGCNRSAEQTPAAETAAADSTADSLAAAAPDSVAADSTSGGGFLSGLFGRREEEPKKEEPVPVELAAAGYHDLPRYLTATATLEPEKQANVLAKIDGEITGMQAEEGDWVEAGELLAVLDGAAQEVALQEAHARVRALELDLERVRSLHEQQLASEKDLHDAESQFEQAEAQRRAAQLQADYTRICAPFSGQITERFVDLGQTVAPGTPLFALVDPEPLLAKIYLPEKEALRIEPGQSVMISPDTDPSRQVPGEVLRVAPIVDRRTGTVKVTCHVSSAGGDLLPGSFVRTQVETEMHRNVLAIPKRALVQEGAETFVFKVVADSVLKVLITTGVANHVMIAVAEGLSAGDEIVAVGHGALKTGSKIRPIPPEPVVVADVDSGNAERL